jgi:hypothetical protein
VIIIINETGIDQSDHFASPRGINECCWTKFSGASLAQRFALDNPAPVERQSRDAGFVQRVNPALLRYPTFDNLSVNVGAHAQAIYFSYSAYAGLSTGLEQPVGKLRGESAIQGLFVLVIKTSQRVNQDIGYRSTRAGCSLDQFDVGSSTSGGDSRRHAGCTRPYYDYRSWLTCPTHKVL